MLLWIVELPRSLKPANECPWWDINRHCRLEEAFCYILEKIFQIFLCWVHILYRKGNDTLKLLTQSFSQFVSFYRNKQNSSPYVWMYHYVKYNTSQLKSVTDSGVNYWTVRYRSYWVTMTMRLLTVSAQTIDPRVMQLNRNSVRYID